MGASVTVVFGRRGNRLVDCGPISTINPSPVTQMKDALRFPAAADRRLEEVVEVALGAEPSRG